MSYRILDTGDAALTIEFGSTIDPALLAAVNALDAAIRRLQQAGELAGVIETMPTFRSLAVFFDPLVTDRDALLAALPPLIAAAEHAPPAAGRRWRLPVCYEGEAAPDLAEFARTLGLDEAEVVALHSGNEYRVYMLGFLPGFPFMGDLPVPLRLPRRTQPRVRVPAGSVAVATGLTAIYPWESPGGWHLLGRCPVPLFDARRASPSLLAAGDRVRFNPVSADACRAIEAGLRAGELDPMQWLETAPPVAEKAAGSAPAQPRPQESALPSPGEAGAQRQEGRPVSTHTELEILSPGAYASIQDGGRRGFRRIGVPWAGALDRRLMRIANALAGRTEDAPLIECFDGGLHLAARGGAVKVAVAGDALLEVDGIDGRRRLAPWRSVTLADGEHLRIRKLGGGRIAMVAVIGLDLPAVMGSAATYARAGLGGVDGRTLTAGLRLALADNADPWGSDRVLPRPPELTPGPIRLVPGPQDDHFSAAALEALVSGDYRVTTETDRMGIRLEGARLEHAGAAEIVSDATVPGSIQVPGTGQPIVLLADAQTAGGYPKIATVIGADLGRLAALRPGQSLRFISVSAAEGARIARAAEAQTRALIAAIRPLPADGIDLVALYTTNLVGGVANALGAEYRPEVSA
ncbi:5-oxoprolinase subunit PxpB [Thauera aromatica]|nr:5-oxoprolinase subunit PxpB [Thauera aromatica]